MLTPDQQRITWLEMLVALYEQPPSMSEGEHNDWLLQVEELREKLAAPPNAESEAAL